MKTLENPTAAELALLRNCRNTCPQEIIDRCKEIFLSVKRRGDEALIEYTHKFDQVELSSIWLNVADYLQPLSDEFCASIEIAIENIREFHSQAIRKDFEIETSSGVKCARRVCALKRIGLYIPAGTAPLFSTLLMLVIPAQIAQVQEIVICIPPGKSKLLSPEMAYVANRLGIKQICPIGGAQAIAAMCIGTPSIAAVSKIFGPGNDYVNQAKLLAQQSGTAIDLPAGPSEVAILIDESSDPEFVAWDLLAQAEHDPGSQLLVVSTSAAALATVQTILKQILELIPRREIARKSIANSLWLTTASIDSAFELINAYAPEHLIICCKQAETLSERVESAGCVFVGAYSAEAFGDYASGTNHVLPTAGAARAWSGVTLESFQKTITFQQIDINGVRSLGPSVITLAQAEGLAAHAGSVEIRLKKSFGARQ